MRGNSDRSRAVSTRTTIHALIARESMPEVSARVEDLFGAETVFLTVGTRYVTGGWEHSTVIALSGDRSSVLAVLDECRQAVEKLGEPE